MSKKKYKTGVVLKIPEKYVKAIDTLFLEISSFDEMLDMFAVKYKLAYLKVWKLVHEIFPGTMNFRCSYDQVDKTILLTSKEEGEMGDLQIVLALKRILKEKEKEDIRNC